MCVTIPEILAIDPTMSDINFVEAEVAFRNLDAKVDIYNENGKKSSIISNADVFASAVEVNNMGFLPNGASEPERDYIDEALKHVDYLEIDRIINSGNWLFAFVAAVENLPICITLSTARKERLGFPLIYVNKYFEVTSGYQRSEIMGANCKFLQRNANGVLRSEVESVERLSSALRNAEPVKAAITNFRRDGTPFRNLLSMKPVFDMKGVYQYVIGIQFDISSPKSNSFSLRIIDSLMNLLPNVVAA
uniref:Putative LOV domain-containing protein n=1 Tax=Synura petersenii TaxID=52555 RepID=A0A126WW00_9STRA|nr:putative LOV domain-containing protein [Synura petersenii]